MFPSAVHGVIGRFALNAAVNSKRNGRSWRWIVGIGLMSGMTGGMLGWSQADYSPGKIELDISKLQCKNVQGHSMLKPAVVVSCGSFNPPTIVHLRMFELAKDELLKRGYDLMGGYMSPVHDGYGKKCLESAHHRVQMCKLATDSSPLIMVDEREANDSGYLRTRQVLQYIEADLDKLFSEGRSHLTTRVMLLCGEDLLESMSTPGVWKPEDVGYILEHHGVVCVRRSGSNYIDQIAEKTHELHKYRANIIPIQDSFNNSISSSTVRDLLHSGRSVKYIVPEPVLDYIKELKLYSKT